MTPNNPDTQPTVTEAEYSEQALADRCIDFLEERADAWMEEEGVQRMFNAIASVFEAHAPQEIMDRFREQLGVIGRQCHVEGALRVWEEIAAQQRAIGRPLPANPETIARHRSQETARSADVGREDIYMDLAAAFGPILKQSFPSSDPRFRYAIAAALSEAVKERSGWFAPQRQKPPATKQHNELIEQAVQAALDAGLAENGVHGVAAARHAARFIAEQREYWREYERAELADEISQIKDARAALTTPPADDGWQPIETCPPEDLFIGAVFVRNNNTGAEWWERHLLALDDETGDIHADYEQGWALADYEWWHPLNLPALPARQALSSRGE